MIRFAFAGRVSTEDLQDPAASLRSQLSRACQLIDGHGEIVEQFFDVGQSRAVAWSRRPESSRLLLALPGAEGPEVPVSVSVREDKITPHLGAALICAHAGDGSAHNALDVPRDCAAQATAIRHLGLTLTYDHMARALSVPTPSGPVAISLR